MRRLNTKQKVLIKRWFEKNKANIPYFCDAEALPIYWEVYRLNEFENFNSAVESYVGELLTAHERLEGRRIPIRGG